MGNLKENSLMKYQFSVPMPDKIEQIKQIKEINDKVEKSVISNLYFALPISCPDNTGFEQLRTNNKTITTIDDYIPIIEETKQKGFEFTYLLNSPKPLLYESRFLEQQFEKLDILIQKLQKLECRKFRVGNIHLIDYLTKNYPQLEIFTSTSFEYQTIKQYINLLSFYPNIKEIVPAVDLNKNFKLLKNIKKEFPNLRIELMVNEGCIYSCPFRYQHFTSLPYRTENKAYNNKLKSDYFVQKCNDFSKQNALIHLCNHNIIYPWEIEEYGKIGIYNFKIAGRDLNEVSRTKHIEYYLSYLLGIDNLKNIENEPIRIFNHYIVTTKINYKVKEIKDYLPNIEYFKAHGHLCSSECGVECNYCCECATKIRNYWGDISLSDI